VASDSRTAAEKDRMIVDDLIKNRASWLLKGKDPSGIIISSRVRLARNVGNHLFPGLASDEECRAICRSMREAFEHLSCFNDTLFFDMETLDGVDREILKERHLISPEMADMGVGSGLLVGRDEGIAIMINEEDHLRLQAISPGLNLLAVWKRINAVDTELEQWLDYAFSGRLGYLTACPTNVGTGLRASVMMHLAGLRLIDEVEQVIKGLDKMGLAVRGLLGEGTEAYGNMFQISNQSTLGESEENLIGHLMEVASEVAEHERNARERLIQERRTHLLDQIGRAFGLLFHARLLQSNEALDLLSGIRLGVEFDVIRNVTVEEVNEMMLLTQPGHLQRMAGRTIGPDERDELRAGMLRDKLKNVEIVEN